MKNPLIEYFKNKKQWVNYTILNRNGKKTKLPFSPITRKAASSTNELDWGTYEEAISVNKNNIGIVFTPEKLLLGIDLDHVLDEKGKITDPTVFELLAESNSYVEISPSGFGLHIYFILDEPMTLIANRHENFETYSEGRYFTVTGNSFGKIKKLRTVTKEEAIALLAIIGYPWGKEETGLFEKQIKGDGIKLMDKQFTPGIIDRMFKSKGGDKIKALYNGDISAYKNDGSIADMALLSHLAFWTGKDATAMEAIWIASPLGSREKTQKRADYRIRSINNAIKACKTVYEPSPTKVMIEELELDLMYTTTKDGGKQYIQNTENICRILRAHPKLKTILRYDLFKSSSEIYRNNEWRALKDSDIIDVQTEISVLFPVFAKIPKEMVRDAMTKIFEENQIDSAKEWLESLVWDKTPRLDNWLCNTYHVEENIYYKAVASNWMKGLVKRALEPGCKFDHVLVLEGAQGIKKSTSLSILGTSTTKASSWHIETTMSTDSKDFFMQFKGKMIVEFSEGETLSRTEVKKMKAIISNPVDTYRPPYGRESVDFPRRCVFAMTTNQAEYLKDDSGDRRWLPVACEGIVDIQWLKENREQLFAEAYYRLVIEKETIHEFPAEETKQMQLSRRIHDPNEDLIADWYFNKLNESQRDEGITIHQAYRDGLHGGMMAKPLDKYNEMSIATILRDSIRLEKRRKSVSGIQQTRWYLQIVSAQSAMPVLSESNLDKF